MLHELPRVSRRKNELFPVEAAVLWASRGCWSKSIDVRRWHRRARLSAGQTFSWAWACAGEPSGSIKVRAEEDAVTLIYRTRHLLPADWKAVEQRVPVTWTPCHLGGQRPWFVCAARVNGRYCGRRVAVLYLAGEVFACRKCYGLAYASQQARLAIS